jgi:HK97 family phage major capsid protein
MSATLTHPRADFDGIVGKSGEKKEDKKESGSADPVAAIVEKIDAVGKRLDDAVTKADAAKLQKEVNELKQQVKEIKVGEPNSLSDRTYGYKHIGEVAVAVMKYGESHGQIADEKLKAALTKATSNEPFAVPLPPAFSPYVGGLSNHPNLKAADTTGVTQGSPFQVGTLFKPQFAPGIGDAGWSTDSLLSRVKIVPIDASASELTFDYVDDENRTNGIKGGMTASWKSELGQMTGVAPKLRQITLRPQELYCMAYASDKSLRNSPIALGAFLQGGMSEAVDFKVGDTIVNGDGAGKPRGILNSPDLISVAKETSQGAATFTHPNVTKMWRRMPAQWRTGAIWLMNQDVEEALDRMAYTYYVNAGTSTESTVPPSVFNQEKNTLKGRPVVFCEYCQTLGTTGDVFLWAPQRYLVAVKTGQGPEMSMHLKFDYAQTAFRVIFEIDGRSEFDAALTPYKGTVTRSAIVSVATR